MRLPFLYLDLIVKENNRTNDKKSILQIFGLQYALFIPGQHKLHKENCIR